MNLRSAIRMSAIALQNKGLDYAICFSEDVYREYIDMLRFDVIGLMPVDYISYCHTHEDWYYHTTTRQNAEKIMEDGYFDRSPSLDSNGVGRAIYTFPTSSGRCYVGEDSVTIKFKTNSKHYHIVGANDSIHALGECVFVEDKLYFDELKFLSGYELELDRNRSFNQYKCLKHDFGFNDIEIRNCSKNITLGNLEEFMNYIFNRKLFDDEFYKCLNKEIREDIK